MRGGAFLRDGRRSYADVRIRAALAYRLFDFSSDQGIEADGPDLASSLVDLARAVAHVVTDGSSVRPLAEKQIDVAGAGDVPGTAVAFVNEVVYLFDVEHFLVGGGELRATTDAKGTLRVQGRLLGETFDPSRHASGRGVKAATYHEATYTAEGGQHRLRVILDL